MRVVVVTMIIGWELWTLFVDDPSYPTLSVVIHHIWHRRAALVVSYVLWLWLGWWIVRPRRVPWGRGIGLAAVPAVAAFAWWATSLPHDIWRWPSLGIPAAGLLVASFAVRLLGRRVAERPEGAERAAGANPVLSRAATSIRARRLASRWVRNPRPAADAEEAAVAYRAAPTSTPPGD